MCSNVRAELSHEHRGNKAHSEDMFSMLLVSALRESQIFHLVVTESLFVYLYSLTMIMQFTVTGDHTNNYNVLSEPSNNVPKPHKMMSRGYKSL